MSIISSVHSDTVLEIGTSAVLYGILITNKPLKIDNNQAGNFKIHCHFKDVHFRMSMILEISSLSN